MKQRLKILRSLLLILIVALDQASATHLDPCWQHRPGNHPQVLHDIAVPLLRAQPQYIPAGRFQTIDDGYAWTGAMGEPSFPDADAPLIADYQATSCWERQGTQLLYRTFMARRACDGSWKGVWENWSATGYIWHDRDRGIDRFRLVDSTGTWIYVGWVSPPTATQGPIIHQEVFKDPNVEPDKVKRGGDIGWSATWGIPPGTPTCP